MVLGDGRDDDVAALQPQPVDEMVDRLGRVATDDRDVIGAVATGEPEGGLAGILVRRGRLLRPVARSSVDARVHGQELLNALEHRGKRAG